MRYRKKPVEIDAWQWDGSNPFHQEPRPEWLIQGRNISFLAKPDGTRLLMIGTLEGDMTGNPGFFLYLILKETRE